MSYTTRRHGGVDAGNDDSLCASIESARGPSLAQDDYYVDAPRWGETVMLDSWATSADGWLRRLHRGGTTLYVAVGRPTGKPEANDYLAMAGAGGTDCDVDALARAVIQSGEYSVSAACRGLEPNEWTGRFVKDLLPVKSEWRRW